MFGYTRVSNAHLRALKATVAQANTRAAQAELKLAKVQAVLRENTSHRYRMVPIEDLQTALDDWNG